MATSMEVDNDSASAMAPAGTPGSVTIALHPLVIMNISEHWTRIRAQNDGKPQQVIGALIGKLSGRDMEVMNSFELVFHVNNGEINIDKEYLAKKDGQFKQVFSELDVLGWYTTGGAPTQNDIEVQKQMGELYASPILLKLNPQVKHTDLPVFVFESVIDIVKGETKMLFVELEYILATEDAERIGVDHIARTSTLSEVTSPVGSSMAADHLQAQHNAVRMLHSRVKIILEYLKAMEDGKLQKRHDILRDVHSLCHRLPVVKTKEFNQEFLNQTNDVHLMAYLATITKSCNNVNKFVTKFNTLYEKQGMGRRVRGLFF